MNKLIQILQKYQNKIAVIILSSTIIISTAYSFILAYKRYINFEYGKFDLGNMSQIVWNTSKGRFMEVTDQFGTNMPRWGMSHVDPILALFAPVYWIYPHPMVLVLAQHILIISAIIPLFLLVRMKLNNDIVGYLVSFTYLLYPAIGFTLVWTGFHGISFVAPLFIWIVWLLERNKFFSQEGYSKIWVVAYWVLIVLMLMGKEEIGAILALGCIPLYFFNKKLAVQTFIVAFGWFVIAFFVIIPAYSHLRVESINTFIEGTGIGDAKPNLAAGDNFFLHRYEHLGSSYPEMLRTIITKPQVVFKTIFTQDKIAALNQLFGPFGYIVLLFPLWLIAAPDFAIVLLSNDQIFDISNHRIAFVISAIFISYIYVLSFINKKTSKYRYKNIINILVASFVLLLTIYFSDTTNNPLYVSGKSFIEGKIISKVIASETEESQEMQIGEVRRSKVPRNDVQCLNDMVEIIGKINPRIYSGPDYLGAHASNREVNALFPARYWDADLVIADVFETKTVGPIGAVGWPFNKEGLRRLYDTDRYEHIYSCGKMSAFLAKENGITNPDVSELIEQNESDSKGYEVSLDNLDLSVTPVVVPEVLDKNNVTPITIDITITGKDTMHDKTTFWTFENADDSDINFSFINYISLASREGLDKSGVGEIVRETYYPSIHQRLPSGEYRIFYGVGDLLNAKDVYIGTVSITE